MKEKVYTGRKTSRVAFPLGGIGTGMITLGGWGELRDWEIRNRPSKGFSPRHSFFTLRVEKEEGGVWVKVLQGPVKGGYNEDGHSASRKRGEGLPHFSSSRFIGNFPLARIEFKDSTLPFLQVRLSTFNPFIPLNDRDSSIPVAILIYSLKNKSSHVVKGMVFGNLENFLGEEKRGRECEEREGRRVRGIFLSHRLLSPSSPSYGSLALSTTREKVRVWRGWESLRRFWEGVSGEEVYIEDEGGDFHTLQVDFEIAPGESIDIPFFITWHFPNFEKYWDEEKPVWKNYYACLWDNAWDVAEYVGKNLDSLYQDTLLFTRALWSSTLPLPVLDAISSQISILKTPTCLRLPDGTFYGFEGSSNYEGCCEGSCTHVWNYAVGLSYLFPQMERSMIEAHLTNSVEEDGFMSFRMPLPLGSKKKHKFHPAADGQMGFILRIYRDWLLRGDKEWLQKIWGKVNRLMEFVWKCWDRDRDGVMEGVQHNTYDIELYGPNTMTGSLYLAALKAMGELSRVMREREKAEEYWKLAERGSRWSDENLFNGEYYEQKIYPEAAEGYPLFLRELLKTRDRDHRFRNLPRYQIGKGCLSDQLVGQWHAHILGLGYLYDPDKVREALRSIFRYNWKERVGDEVNFLRIYALGDEPGLLICTWPRGEKLGDPIIYAEEVWCGIEYEVASLLIFEGMIEEGIRIVEGARSRFNGEKRNPWDEFECGHHYARSLASFSLLLALTGFFYSAPSHLIRFYPRMNSQQFQAFFSVPSGWGIYRQNRKKKECQIEINLLKGVLQIKEIIVGGLEGDIKEVEVNTDRRRIEIGVKKEKDSVSFVFSSVEKILPPQPLLIRILMH